MAIALWLAIGAFLGAISKTVMPGPNPLGFAAILLGAVAAVVGGLVGVALTNASLNAIDARCILSAIAGALMVLIAYRSYALHGETQLP